MSGPHRVSFRGTVVTGPLAYTASDLILADAAAPTGTVEARYPPRTRDAEALAERVARTRPERLVAAGDGATLDVAKHAWTLLPGPARPELVLAPLGAEPWRAFAPFTSLYEPDGERVSRRDDALGGGLVVIDGRALAGRAATVRHLQRADSAVHAVEVLIGRRAGPWGRALAAAALAALAADDPAGDVAAAGLATEAFASAGLGLAHAVASPLGALAGRTHDTVNALLAPYTVDFWGDRVDWAAPAAGLGVPPRAGAVADRLRELRDRAGVPQTLREAGFDRGLLERAVPRALRSSGIPWLPAPVTAEDVTGLLDRAWAGR
ncbi:iron-containing alcohol dehydrogenase [Phytohabitans sp. ZYX-F-186]|uniref:Iron-containing alcohol dehydrogenase n=1 Tax=Phytohabitans maris TaxID=3071409 RepID=A0ABU0ZN58_9ACTN|nr:iron-containing alcohol dehydrogenase [Phytohabitans sp. ZYX-F-186]MDQ7908478.1 iron-containing alcohol dehydrogenase [Phytohabitans sp. ZYX-F-186]